jgi:hypothetical protein
MHWWLHYAVRHEAGDYPMPTHIRNGKMTKRKRETAKRLEKDICAPRISKTVATASGRRKSGSKLLYHIAYLCAVESRKPAELMSFQLCAETLPNFDQR